METESGGRHTSSNPNPFPRAAFRCGIGVVGVGFLLDDFDDLLDGQVCLRVLGADAGDADVARNAVEVGGEDFSPLLWLARTSALVGHGLRADGEEVPFRSDGVIHADVVDREGVGVCAEFNLAGVIEGEIFKMELFERADADAEVVTATEFEVRLVIELELMNVHDAAQRDVADGAIERGAIVKTLHAGQDADGIGRRQTFGRSGDVFDGDALDGTVAGRVVFPFLGIERHVVIVRIASHATNDAIA